jgi:hypothetical protein
MLAFTSLGKAPGGSAGRPLPSNQATESYEDSK